MRVTSRPALTPVSPAKDRACTKDSSYRFLGHSLGVGLFSATIVLWCSICEEMLAQNGGSRAKSNPRLVYLPNHPLSDLVEASSFISKAVQQQHARHRMMHTCTAHSHDYTCMASCTCIFFGACRWAQLLHRF